MYRIFKRISDRVVGLGSSFVGDPPDAVNTPYLFVWGRFPARKGTLLSDTQNVVDTEINVTCVAASPANALKLAADTENLLADWSPTIEGWFIEPLEVAGTYPLQSSQQHTDPDTNRIPEAVVLALKIRAYRTT